jgi:hypothetical protein
MTITLVLKNIFPLMRVLRYSLTMVRKEFEQKALQQRLKSMLGVRDKWCATVQITTIIC